MLKHYSVFGEWSVRMKENVCHVSHVSLVDVKQSEEPHPGIGRGDKEVYSPQFEKIVLLRHSLVLHYRMRWLLKLNHGYGDTKNLPGRVRVVANQAHGPQLTKRSEN